MNTGLAGFAQPDSQGVWRGFDAEYCRAIAAAIFGDATKVRFVPTTAQVRFTALQSGEVDVLSRNTTWTLSRDTSLGLDFAATNFYDGQGFMVKASLGVKSAKELEGATICVQPGTTTEQNLTDWSRANKIKFTPVVIERLEEIVSAYIASRCDAYTTDVSGLAVHALGPAEAGRPPDPARGHQQGAAGARRPAGRCPLRRRRPLDAFPAAERRGIRRHPGECRQDGE